MSIVKALLNGLINGGVEMRGLCFMSFRVGGATVLVNHKDAVGYMT